MEEPQSGLGPLKREAVGASHMREISDTPPPGR
jgi:hypothetical protein